jgi:hypothetical protein
LWRVGPRSGGIPSRPPIPACPLLESVPVTTLFTSDVRCHGTL